MFKFAALVSLVSAGSFMQEVEDSAELFKVVIRDKKLDEIKAQQRQYLEQQSKYAHNIQNSPHFQHF